MGGGGGAAAADALLLIKFAYLYQNWFTVLHRQPLPRGCDDAGSQHDALWEERYDQSCNLTHLGHRARKKCEFRACRRF